MALTCADMLADWRQEKQKKSLWDDAGDLESLLPEVSNMLHLMLQLLQIYGMDYSSD